MSIGLRFSQCNPGACLYCESSNLNAMTQWRTEDFLKILTYALLFFIILVALWSSDWHLALETNVPILFLIAYTLLLVLPIKSFKLGPSGFEGELERLERGKGELPPAPETVRGVNQEIDKFSANLVEPDVVLMRLSIEIETTLRNIAEASGAKRQRVPMGMLIQEMKQKEIITDKWLLDALSFFQHHRNELIHEGKTDDIEKAIDVGRTVLAKLREIRPEDQKKRR
jgi:hypothetical protein